MANKQSRIIQHLQPLRGKILDRNGVKLALDLRLLSLGVNPKRVKNAPSLAHELEMITGLHYDFLFERITRDKSFVWIARQLPREQTDAILLLKNQALEFRPEWKRAYPNNEEAAQVIGFTGIDHQGLEGVELEYDSYLKGIAGWKSTRKDAKQREIVSRQMDLVLPVDGYDLYLSLDANIQHVADDALRLTVEKYRALGGSVVVMDAETGDVLALANYPGFDLNAPGESEAVIRKNRAITDIFEPGSVFKTFTLAAALEHKVVNVTDTVFCEQGAYRTGGRILHDTHPYGDLSVTDVLVKSSNIGISKIMKRLGNEKMFESIRRFGFGEKTQIDLPGEISGLLRKPEQWSKPSQSSIGIGQEIGVTAIQLTTAMASIVNGGILVKPRIVLKIEDTKQSLIKTYGQENKRRVISKKVADEMQSILIQVVERGTGRRARVEGAVIGGKTGTSQKLEPDGSYSHSHFIASFVGFLRHGGKTIVIGVSVDDPGPQYYGGTVAAPVFAKIAQTIVEYWQ